MQSEVFNIDCLEYMKTLPDKAFDLAIADPPYGGAGDDRLDGGALRSTIRQVQGKHIKLDSTSKKDRMFKYRKTSTITGGGMQQEDGLSDTKEPG